ncbi:MAG: ferredoxin reductase family protein, partial [Vicinamibacterales bacterium]
MQLSLRGLAWFSLYLTITLVPAFVALAADPFALPRSGFVEASVALAFIAFPLLLAQFALVSRLRALSAGFGTDVLMQFHRQMGIVALAFVVLHVLLLAGRGASWPTLDPFSGSWAMRSGAIALWSTLLIVASSVVRRRVRLRYEAWQVIHLAAAITIVIAASAHIVAIAGYSRAASVRGAVIGYGAVALALATWYRVARPLTLMRRPWRVVANRDEGASTRTLCVRPEGHDGMTFTAGQFAWLLTGRSPLLAQQHPLSMSSSAAPNDEHAIDFTIKALGDWSANEVPALVPGSRVWVDGPFGAFTEGRQPAQGLVLVAGGIGISPMRSILRTLRDRGDVRPVLLFYAANDASRTVFGDELRSLERSLNLTLVYVFEHANGEWRGERGRITESVLRRHLPHHFKRFQYFVCGPGGMMDATERLLIGIGVPRRLINTERFD